MNRFLSQDEVNALLRGISEGGIEAEQDKGGDHNGVRVYDLTNQERIIRGQIPVLEIMNQKMAHQLCTSLSGTLCRTVDVNALNVEITKFGEFLNTLSIPTSMHAFRMRPLQGCALLVIESTLVFALIDIFFGGTGNMNVKIGRRDFTPIESHMILRVTDVILKEMERAWEPIKPIRVELEHSEINPQFVDVIPPSEVVVTAPFEIEMDEARGTISVCIPYSTIEPMRSRLYTGSQSECLEVDQSYLHRILRQLEGTEVEVSVEIGTAEINLEMLLNLQEGDIILLDQEADDELLLKVEGVPKFTGCARKSRQKKAVQITGRLNPLAYVKDDEYE